MSTKAPGHHEPWQDLLAQWQRAAGEWSQWWTRTLPPQGAATPGSGHATPGADAPALAELNARFAPRFRALVEAAMQPTAADAIPVVAQAAPGDRRFRAAAWREQPYFALLRQWYLLYGEYLQELARLAPLPDPQKRRLQFALHQYVDAIAPTNYPATNPEVLERAIATEGASLVQGLRNLAQDMQKGRITMSDETAFGVGRNLALTPGSVVYRNELFELLQYAPTTPAVHRRPLVIVPPCINKYYILDLRPDNSFVRHAVDLGHTVFMISWRNIPEALGALTWDDYVERGALQALRVAQDVSGSRTVNALGFCVGGTLLACTLAVLAARHDHTVASATFLTTMLDFAEPGEIGDFYVSRELLNLRESALMGGARVHGSELASAFASMRANDLVWNYVVNNYLKGETPPAFDLLYWNGDSSNLPGPMYVYYLSNMYLDNRLRERNALTMAGESIDLSRIGVPAYIYASRDDHIVPWHSAYKTTALLSGDLTFVLGASGHIAGVVNPPHPPRRNFWVNPLLTDDPEDWLARAQSVPGSWWPHWGAWLAEQGGPQHAAPRHPGNAHYPALEPAPGRYVREAA
jgi:polyhydroxyalkanoate synthase